MPALISCLRVGVEGVSKDRKRVESGDKVADVRRLRLQRMKRNNLC